MATKLKDIPFETLVPTIVPADKVPTYDESFDSDEDRVAVVGAREIQMLDASGSYRTVVTAGYGGNSDIWMFAGAAEYADCAGYVDYACEADRAGYADYACEADRAGYADYACEADRAGYADYACEADCAGYADYACGADRAGYADYACEADCAGYADRTDMLGVCDSIYANGEHLMVSIGDFFGYLSLRSASELQDSDAYVLVVV